MWTVLAEEVDWTRQIYGKRLPLWLEQDYKASYKLVYVPLSDPSVTAGCGTSPSSTQDPDCYNFRQ